VVRFFGRTTRKTAAKKTAVDDNGASAAREPAAEKRTTVRRRAPARPPKRDWAAEAAATPIGKPTPRPSSLASTPSEDTSEAASTSPAKRRRGTRGGRGRKKATSTATSANGAAAATPEPLTTAPASEPAGRIRDLRTSKTARTSEPPTLEALVAQQSAMLERFARDVTSTMQRLQDAISDLEGRVGGGTQTAAAPRVAIFVDVPNLVYAAERRKVNIDFGRVLDFFTRDREFVRATAYAPITDDPQAKLENQRFVQHFVGHPYRIVTKPLKRFADGSMKANFDIELAIDILTMSDRLDIVVLMSGDGDFRRVVELVASRGVRVEVAAFSETASAELKSVADRYVDLSQHIDEFRQR
jgi:uncharacterized LabA/DUF88 family protein